MAESTWDVGTKALLGDSQSVCAICLCPVSSRDASNDEGTACRLPCGCELCYHTRCIACWLAQQNSCPQCRLAPNLPEGVGTSKGKALALLPRAARQHNIDHLVLLTRSTLDELLHTSKEAVSASGSRPDPGDDAKRKTDRKLQRAPSPVASSTSEDTCEKSENARPAGLASQEHPLACLQMQMSQFGTASGAADGAAASRCTIGTPLKMPCVRHESHQVAGQEHMYATGGSFVAALSDCGRQYGGEPVGSDEPAEVRVDLESEELKEAMAAACSKPRLSDTAHAGAGVEGWQQDLSNAAADACGTHEEEQCKLLDIKHLPVMYVALSGQEERAPTATPVAGQPVAGQPVAGQPVAGQPVADAENGAAAAPAAADADGSASAATKQKGAGVKRMSRGELGFEEVWYRLRYAGKVVHLRLHLLDELDEAEVVQLSQGERWSSRKARHQIRGQLPDYWKLAQRSQYAAQERAPQAAGTTEAAEASFRAPDTAQGADQQGDEQQRPLHHRPGRSWSMCSCLLATLLPVLVFYFVSYLVMAT